MSVVLQTKVNTAPARKMLERLAAELTLDKADVAVEAATFKLLSVVVIDTKEAIATRAKKPRWNIAQPENKWLVEKLSNGYWVVVNRDRVMGFLEHGTRAHGPVRAKSLFIPLSRRAVAGFQKGFKWGVDFIFAKWVRGIQPYGIAETARQKAKLILYNELLAFVHRAVAKAQG